MQRIDALSYYNVLPASSHACGDIWRGLPSFGLAGLSSVTGLLVTPACDMSWGKSETATYLPIIPVRSYFSLDAALPLIQPRLLNLLGSLSKLAVPDWQKDGYFAPPLAEIADCESAVSAWKSGQQLGTKEQQTKDSCLAGLKIVRAIAEPSITLIPGGTLSQFFGSQWEQTKQKIITNSFSPALHFVPSDCQAEAFSAVPEHSVILFRYPITIPVKLLIMAQESSPAIWVEAVNNSNLSDSTKAEAIKQYPIKLLSLKSAFLSDVLTRFSALYNRIGSPDFTKDTVTRFSLELDQ